MEEFLQFVEKSVSVVIITKEFAVLDGNELRRAIKANKAKPTCETWDEVDSRIFPNKDIPEDFAWDRMFIYEGIQMLRSKSGQIAYFWKNEASLISPEEAKQIWARWLALLREELDEKDKSFHQIFGD